VDCISLHCLRLACKEPACHRAQHIVTSFQKPSVAPRPATCALEAQSLFKVRRPFTVEPRLQVTAQPSHGHVAVIRQDGGRDGNGVGGLVHWQGGAAKPTRPRSVIENRKNASH
jgi:hypothetical protein